MKVHLAKRSLIDFARFTHPQYIAEKAHFLIASYLDRVVRGEITRLLIFAPPQTGKSELVSVRFPAYWFGHRPNDPVLLASYGASLAEAKSREARNLVMSDDYREVFPDVQVNQMSRAVQYWQLAKPNRGFMLAAGVAGPLTGRGGYLGIIDDPVSSWEEAQSTTMRNKAWEWYQGTFRTRIWEGGAIVVIMTRWHADDLAGRLLESQPGQWTVLRLPMIAESQKERDESHRFLGLPVGQSDPLNRKLGEVLVPKRFSQQEVQAISRDVGSLVFSAEYQAIPRPAEGYKVKREWLAIVGAAPIEARRVRYWDKAGSQDSGDYSSGVLLAEVGGVYYVEDVVRGQWSVFERQKIMLQTSLLDAMRYGRVIWAEDDNSLADPKIADEVRYKENGEIKREDYVIENPGVDIWVEQEGGSGGKDSALIDIKLMTGFKIRAHRPTGDKSVRAQGWNAQAEAGNFRIVRGNWNWDYISELTAFPNGAHDDQWDATSGAFSKLAGRQTIKLHTVTA